MPLSAVLKGYQAEKIRMSNNATADERAAGSAAWRRSRDDLPHHIPIHISQTEVAPGVSVRQGVVIESE